MSLIDRRLPFRCDQQNPAVEVAVAEEIDDLGIIAGDRDRLRALVVLKLRSAHVGDGYGRRNQKPAHERFPGRGLGREAKAIVGVLTLKVREGILDVLEVAQVVLGIQWGREPGGHTAEVAAHRGLELA